MHTRRATAQKLCHSFAGKALEAVQPLPGQHAAFTALTCLAKAQHARYGLGITDQSGIHEAVITIQDKGLGHCTFPSKCLMNTRAV